MSTAAAPAPISWVDRKKSLWVLGLFPPTFPLIAAGLVAWTGSPVGWWWGPIFIMILVPIFEGLIGDDRSNPPETALAELEASRYYGALVRAYLPLQYLGLVWAVWRVGRGDLHWVDVVGLGLTVGAVGGVAINAAHELGHKREETERRLARVALAQTCYGHFYVEHNRGHHVRVATPEDPASARYGESFWAFLPRTVIGSARSAWRLERRRLQRAGKPVFGRGNQVLTAWLLGIALMAALLILAAVHDASTLPQVAALLVIQAAYGASLLEVVNYMEHYGLARRQVGPGRYEKCDDTHSWNSNSLASNLLLYQLQRHSDHHANPARRFQALRHFDSSPQLPRGYGTMISLAYVTPLWRKVMDHRVAAHYGGDLSRANHGPRPIIDVPLP
jgi:alkane 1-monooxygenase